MSSEYFNSILIATIVTLFVYALIAMGYSLIEVNRTTATVTAKIEFNWKGLNSDANRNSVTLKYKFNGDSHLEKMDVELNDPQWDTNNGILTIRVNIKGYDKNLNRVEPVREFRDTFLIAPGLPAPENITYKTDYKIY